MSERTVPLQLSLKKKVKKNAPAVNKVNPWFISSWRMRGKGRGGSVSVKGTSCVYGVAIRDRVREIKRKGMTSLQHN